MPSNSHTILICTDAMRMDANNLFRGLPRTPTMTYDDSPPEFDPNPGSGTFGTRLASAAAIAASATPWLVPVTHWMASAWELPNFAAMMATLKAGGLDNITSRDWAVFNLNKNRAIAAGSSLYSRTMDWLGSEMDLDAAEQRTAIVSANMAAALAEAAAVPLQKIPSQPRPGLG